MSTPETAVAGNPTHTAPIPTKFAHVVYRTGDLPRLREWHCTVLQAHAVYDNGNMCFLTFDDEHHRVAMVQLPDLAERDMTHTGVDHVAYTLASVADLVSHYERLRAADITPFWCVNHGITLSMYYCDPDGNQVEFQVDRYAPDEHEQLAAFFAGPFQDNPIGINYDPEDLVTKCHDGVPAAELLTPGVI